LEKAYGGVQERLGYHNLKNKAALVTSHTSKFGMAQNLGGFSFQIDAHPCQLILVRQDASAAAKQAAKAHFQVCGLARPFTPPASWL
jgi:hypothetical protein